VTQTYECRQAPIAMINCFYPAVVFEANPAFAQRATGEPVALHVDTSNIRFEPVPDAANSFVVSLTIRLSWPDEAVPPYRNAWLEAVGIFQAAPGLPPAAFEKHRALSGPSMLYSSAREYVKLITLNGPWGGVMLPGLVFQEAGRAETGPVGVGAETARKRGRPVKARK
jgi:preprotein translocase subunit SecB